MGAPAGFAFTTRGAEVRISHHGRHATTLRGSAAAEFLAEVVRVDAQQLMARATGNYRRGNERVAKTHPRNQRTSRS